MHLAEITTERGEVLSSNNSIGEAVVSHFSNQYMEESIVQDFSMIECIPKLISKADNDRMTRLLLKDEVKQVIVAPNGNSVAGLVGFSRLFFQKTWDIIRDDLTKMVQAFFCGHKLPRFVTYTNLVLLPKKEFSKTCSNLRLISLSCFVNKIISRILHERMVEVLSKIISPDQSGFVKGRNIVENVFLAQEIIRDINKRKKHVNVVVKLDMAKAYDRVS